MNEGGHQYYFVIINFFFPLSKQSEQFLTNRVIFHDQFQSIEIDSELMI